MLTLPDHAINTAQRRLTGIRHTCQHATRRGSILVLSAVLLVVAMAFAAFTIDLGFLTLTLAEMQNASDAASLAAAAELGQGTGPAPQLTASAVKSTSSSAAYTVADANPSGDLASTYVDVARDVRFGQYQWDSESQSWTEVWDAEPYTLVEVEVHRDRGTALADDSETPDGPVPLFFAPVIGHQDAPLKAVSAAAIFPGVGFRITEDSSACAPILPIALDEQSWNDLLDGIGSDDYGYNEELDKVESSPDGVLEVNLYPSGSSSMPPGNRGTVDIGSPNNSTSDLKRQIRNGISADDLSWFNGEIRFDGTPLQLNGDTGLSAGIEAALKDIVGQARAIPLFTSVSGPGNNATYVIDRFVGIRILDVNIKGNPNKRRVVIQPAPFMDSTVVRGETTIETDSIFTTPVLTR